MSQTGNQTAKTTVYKGYAADEMEGQFNPRVSLPNVDALIEERRARSAGTLRRLRHEKVSYGAGPREYVDIYPVDRPDAPVHIYIHGGYWRAMSSDDNAYLAEAFHGAGAVTVLLEYELCPKVTVGDIVDQTLAGIRWVYRNIARFGGDPNRIYLSGSSAGGHLVAMTLAHDWTADGLPKDLVKGAVAITGVMDTEPVLHITPNELIRLTPEMAKRTNPMLHPPLPGTPYVIVVGGDEPPGWRALSRDYYEMCKARGVACTFHEIPGTHHFSITNTIADKGTLLRRLVFEQMGLRE